jgi:hypothetical protein
MISHSTNDMRIALQRGQISILALAFSLIVLAVFIRGFTLYYPIKSYWDARWIARETFHRSYYDVMTIFCATLVATLALLSSQWWLRGQRAIVRFYYVFAGLIGAPLMRQFTSSGNHRRPIDVSVALLRGFSPQFYASIRSCFKPRLVHSCASWSVIFDSHGRTLGSTISTWSDVGLWIISLCDKR